jgi:hypothetical protein
MAPARPSPTKNHMRQKTNFVSRIKLIGSSSPRAKIFRFCFSEIYDFFSPSHPARGADRESSRTLAVGCGGREGVGAQGGRRARQLVSDRGAQDERR